MTTSSSINVKARLTGRNLDHLEFETGIIQAGYDSRRTDAKPTGHLSAKSPNRKIKQAGVIHKLVTV
jgi:hypothetical protein